MKFNIYYINSNGRTGKISSQDINGVLLNVNACLVMGDEITGIVNVKDDN